MNWMEYVNAFWVGGAICAACQVFIDKTRLTPARILVSLVVIALAAFVGGSMAYYLLYAMVAWLFALLVYYTVKMI